MAFIAGPRITSLSGERAAGQLNRTDLGLFPTPLGVAGAVLSKTTLLTRPFPSKILDTAISRLPKDKIQNVAGLIDFAVARLEAGFPKGISGKYGMDTFIHGLRRVLGKTQESAMQAKKLVEDAGFEIGDDLINLLK